MGWASGGELLERVLDIVNDEIVGRKRRRLVMRELIEAFSDFDCDVIPEVFSHKWPELEEVYREDNPDEFDDEDCIEDDEE